MIKFFRHIRKSLLMENKTSKYIKYAIGEIVLVVIGILLALQVNNWNERRIQRQNENKFLTGINSEFTLNKAYLLNTDKMNKEALKTGKLLMSLIKEDLKTLKQKNIDSLIFQVFEYGGFEISETTVLEIMQAGQLQNLQSEVLKSVILDWSQKKNRTRRNRENLTSKTDDLVKYLMKRYPLKNIDKYGVLAWDSDSKIQVNKFQIFEDIEFENLIDDYLYNLTNYDTRINDLLKTIDVIINNSKVAND